MTNKNKNIKRLVKKVGQTTSALPEMISRLTHSISGTTLAADVVDNTLGIDESNARSSLHSTSALVDLKSSHGRKIANLDYRLEELKSNLVITSQMITELTSKLATEQESNRKLLQTNETLRADYQRARQQIEFELDVAQQTIDDQDLLNQQLASDLIDNQGYRQALEIHLSGLEKENAQKIKKLEEKLADVEAKSGEHEHKLRIKDGTIANLTQELANQSSKLHFAPKLENALSKIDGHRPKKSTAPRNGERMIRQLIRSADGQELRFPLFRKLLSIGRTRHNDIQIDMRFVSRRHAVIAIDDNATRIIDWGSRNGVYVNKKRITEKILKPGDVITIGIVNLRYEERTKH